MLVRDGYCMVTTRVGMECCALPLWHLLNQSLGLSFEEERTSTRNSWGDQLIQPFEPVSLGGHLHQLAFEHLGLHDSHRVPLLD
jgi:hypothetical protein